MQSHERRNRRCCRWQREFPDERKSIARVQLNVFSHGWQLNAASNFNHLACNLPTVGVPMAASCHIDIGAKNSVRSPRNDVRCPRGYLARTSGAQVRLYRGRLTNGLHCPLTRATNFGAPGTDHDSFDI
jgi:hypothetical protein